MEERNNIVVHGRIVMGFWMRGISETVEAMLYLYQRQLPATNSDTCNFFDCFNKIWVFMQFYD
ncbi:hypothetical protein SAMN05216332_108132 [Nitrosospira briensis]|nr:hypothetical protein SAMN05216332_108132 [Nitrosospira briensis]